MGDRGQIAIEQDNNHFPAPVFFYTHWQGHAIKQRLQEALEKGKGRWDDPSYLARIIFCQLVREEWNKTDGFGLMGVSAGDSEYPLLCVNMREQKVAERASNEDIEAPATNVWTFEAFTKLTL
jgi:hypothetical protein